MKKNGKLPKTAGEAYAEAVRLYHNGKSFLKDVPIEYGAYADTKPVQEACAAGYLAMLRAVDGYLLGRGISPGDLPTSYDGYRDVLEKHVPHNGKIRQGFKIVYQNLHVFGYYRGGVGVEMIKEGFQKARTIIETLTRRRM